MICIQPIYSVNFIESSGFIQVKLYQSIFLAYFYYEADNSYLEVCIYKRTNKLMTLDLCICDDIFKKTRIQIFIKIKMQGQKTYEQQVAEQQKKQQVEEYRQGILSQILFPEAKDRLIKIKLVKPQKAIGIENALIQAAQNGILKNKVSEKQLIAMLERDSQKSGETKKITFKRRGIDDEF